MGMREAEVSDNTIHVLAMSDLHTEFDPFDLPLPRWPDLVLLAGDIGFGAAGITFASRYFPPEVPVAVICGNHEFYRSDIESVLRLCREQADVSPNVRFLENDQVVLTFKERSVRLLGCVLWTDFRLGGNPERSFDVATSRLADFRLIGEGSRALKPNDQLKRHEQSRAWLTDRLAEPFAGTTVVLTHHAPSPRSQHPRFIGDELTPAFVSDLDALILEHQPALWVHGHTHWSVDYRMGATRVYSNQRGYPKEDPGFRLELIAL